MVKIFLMAASISLLVSCKHSEFPVDYYYSPVIRTKEVVLQDGTKEVVVDLKRSFCTQYRVVDKENVVFKKEGAIGLLDCNGMFGTSTSDTPILLDFIREKIKKNRKQIEQLQ